MKPEEIKQWLADDEKKTLANTSKTTITTKIGMAPNDSFDMYFLSAADLELLRDRLIQERELSETRRTLLEKYEWAGKTTSKEKKVFDDVPRKCCLECRHEKVAHRGKHASVCAWDAALKNVGGK